MVVEIERQLTGTGGFKALAAVDVIVICFSPLVGVPAAPLDGSLVAFTESTSLRLHIICISGAPSFMQPFGINIVSPCVSSQILLVSHALSGVTLSTSSIFPFSVLLVACALKLKPDLWLRSSTKSMKQTIDVDMRHAITRTKVTQLIVYITEGSDSY